MRKGFSIIIFFSTFLVTFSYKSSFQELKPTICSVNSNLKNEIAKYASLTKKILDFVKKDKAGASVKPKGATSKAEGKIPKPKGTPKGKTPKGKTPKPKGTTPKPKGKTPKPKVTTAKVTKPKPSTEGPNFIDLPNLIKSAKTYQLENVRKQDYSHQSWLVYKKIAQMIRPRRKDLNIYPLVSTRAIFEIEAQAIVFDSLKDIEKNKKQIKGKIVIFNLNNRNPFAKPEVAGEEFFKAMEYGAAAVLSSCVKSLASLSSSNDAILLTKYKGKPKYNVVPSAYISVEDARMLSTTQKRGDRIVIYMKVVNSFAKTVNVASAIAEIKGSKWPEKFVAVSGIEANELAMSWKVGFILKSLKLKPKRTLRFVGWETGYGSTVPLDEYRNMVFQITAKKGVTGKLGLEFTGSLEGACVLHEIVKLLKSLGPIKVYVQEEREADKYLSLLGYKYIPSADGIGREMKKMKRSRTANTEDSDTAFWAVIAYIVADLSADIPKNTVYYMK